jgi:hypothetical protein
LGASNIVIPAHAGIQFFGAPPGQGNFMNVVFISVVHFSGVLALAEANSEHF